MQKLILLFGLLFLSTCAYAACCSFEIAYTIGALVAPTEETILSCIKREQCDSLFLFTRRMIRADKIDDPKAISSNFKQALSIIEKKQKSDTTSLKIIYMYAVFLERSGESIASAAYYKYVEKNSSTGSILNILSTIGIAGTKNNVKELERIIALVVKEIDQKNFTTDETLSILIRLTNYLNPEQGYSLVQNSSISSLLLLDDLNPELYFIYLKRVIAHLIFKRDKRYNYFFSKAKIAYNSLPKEYYYKSFLHLKSSVSLINGQYNDALKEREELVRTSLDPPETLDNILTAPPKYTTQKYIYINSYAKANLFQTRVRPGIEPVKKAFRLYEIDYKIALKSSLTSVNGIIADKFSHTSTTEINILIVGCYLYQKTNDVSYLSRAISILDGNTGAGNHYWATARNFARHNSDFWVDIMTQRALSNALSSLNSEASLSTISSHQKALKNQQEKILASYPDFFDKLSANNSIDLNEVAEWCKQDSSAVLAFYMANGVHYRLLTTPDTTDIIILNEQNDEILSLTRQLQSISNPKAKAGANAKASRDLYALLFKGIDSLLPPNLHIVATGEMENIPFTALRREAPGEPARYLGAEIAISRQVSINSMRLMRDQERNPRYNRPLGMAPAFANESLPVSELRQAGFVLPPLFYNTEEVESLEARGPGNFFYGKEATLQNYLANVEDYSIIHLATHAISSQADGLLSRIYLASEEGETSELYTSDIGDKTLNADLVVLSACETGTGGRHITEGRISLTKAYLAAGARSVVSSNWAVDDFATAALMEVFYQHIQEGKPPHQALQLSRKAYLEKYPDAPPYKWAAFEAYGGMKPVRWDRSRSVWPMVGYGSLALLSLGIGTVYLKRRRRAHLRA